MPSRQGRFFRTPESNSPPPAWTEPVVIPELAPSTDYYVYAAAAGENDRLSEVASLVLTTLEDPANDLTQQFESLHTPGVAEQNGDNFYFGLSSGETEIQGGLTVTKQAGYAVLFDLYGAASADAVIPDGTYELAQGHVPPSADPRHTYATRRLEDGTWEVLTFAAGEVSVSREGANYLLAANVETPAGERLSFRYAGPIEMKPIDMTGSRLKHAVNVALEEVTAVCYKEYNDPGVDWTQLKFWTGEVDKRGGLVKGTLFGVELNMPTTDDRGDLKLVPGEYEVNASREAFTMVPGAIMDYMPGMLMAYGTYLQENGKTEEERDLGQEYVNEAMDLARALDPTMDPYDPMSPEELDQFMDLGEEGLNQLLEDLLNGKKPEI